MGLGLAGAAYAYCCCNLSSVVLLGGYVACRSISMRGQPGNTWGGFSRQAFSGWGEYLAYGVPTAVMMCMEWWAYEVLVLLAGWLPSPHVSLSVMGICLNICTW
jgi:MATE family multidrug resistance protein